MSDSWSQNFPVVIEQVVDWGDMDSFGHVNNIVYFRYFENVRVEYLQRIGWWDLHQETGIGPILGSVQARFRRPVTFPDTLLCGAKVSELKADRFTLEHQLFSTKRQEVVTEGQGVIVCFDYPMNLKCPLPEAVRLRIEEIEKEKSPDSHA